MCVLFYRTHHDMKLKLSGYYYAFNFSVSPNSNVGRIMFILFTVVYAAPRKLLVANRNVLASYCCITFQKLVTSP